MEKSKTEAWQLTLKDPTGEKRTFTLGNSQILGRSETADIPLRDSLAAPCAVVLSVREPSAGPHEFSDTPFWVCAPRESPPVFLGGLQVREAQIPNGIDLRIGDTRLSIEPKPKELKVKDRRPPEFPSGARPWLTASASGYELLNQTQKVAGTPLSVYLAGETGTGKEVLAHLVHLWSARKSGPFVPLHCAALPLSLVESELFGHVKGAFTGAVQQRPGALVQAHGGTLFLDEVGDLPMDIQVKLLRFLENGEIRPVGSDRTKRVDVRLVCATHQPLRTLAQEGKFRLDLYYRIASVTLEIPPLRSRVEDIEYLARTFARRLNRNISARALMRLKAHQWPGNVRELQHAVECACGLAGTLQTSLGEEAFDFLMTPENIAKTPDMDWDVPLLTFKEMERYIVLKALRLNGGNRAKAAETLGIARSTFFLMLKRHKITKPNKLTY